MRAECLGLPTTVFEIRPEPERGYELEVTTVAPWHALGPLTLQCRSSLSANKIVGIAHRLRRQPGRKKDGRDAQLTQFANPSIHHHSGSFPFIPPNHTMR